MLYNNCPLKMQTVRIIARMLSPLMDCGAINNKEYDVIVTNLSHVAKHGKPVPAIIPKLITAQEAAEMLSICYSQFRALEKEGAFPFKRRSVGNKTVRYKNTDILEYMDICCATQDEPLGSDVEAEKAKEATV
jgi:predicted DNA-binding transcriptional regulator AlpA